MIISSITSQLYLGEGLRPRNHGVVRLLSLQSLRLQPWLCCLCTVELGSFCCCSLGDTSALFPAPLRILVRVIVLSPLFQPNDYHHRTERFIANETDLAKYQVYCAFQESTFMNRCTLAEYDEHSLFSVGTDHRHYHLVSEEIQRSTRAVR